MTGKPLSLQNTNSRFGSSNIKLFLYGCLITIALACFAVFPPPFVQYLNNKSYDLMIRALPPSSESSVPVIVGIDDPSLTQYGQWPWPRYILARLVKKIASGGASAIGMDMILPEQDRTSLSVVLKEMSRERGVDFQNETLQAPKALPGGSPGALTGSPIGPQDENDQILAKVLRSAPAVLAYQFKFGKKSPLKYSDIHPLKYIIKENNPREKHRITSADNVIHSLPMLMRAAGASGFVNSLTDRDGIVRRVPLIMEYKGVLYPSLAMAALIRAYGNQQVMIETTDDGYLIDWNERRIPLDSSGFFLIPYRARDNNYPYISAADILSGKIKPETFKGKIVFIGVNGSGMGDNHLSPVNKMIHGTEIHASIVNSILTGDFIKRPAWAPGAELVFVLAAGLLSSIALALGGAVLCLSFTLIAAFGTAAIFYLLFSTHGIYLSPVMPLSVLLINFVLLNTIKYAMEEIKVLKRSKELIKSQDVAILSLSALAETRDKETGHHILRTQRYVRALAKNLKRRDKYKKILNDQTIELLYKSAPLHDIGKVGIPDMILQKAGPLTEEEFGQMKNHTVIGARTIAQAGRMLDSDENFPYLKYAYDLAISHHEKWDGSGYPNGLAGDAIPLTGRLMAVADVYDALISRRVYKEAFSHENARAAILKERGRHFDPDIVDAFIGEEQTFIQIAREYADQE
ncbi:MAG TPA: CHASE2 domain-containing protein [Smithella sp.]|nr:CHASE2 domain-containing protein [Smithella sp.]